jgi:hypothetical protein
MTEISCSKCVAGFVIKSVPPLGESIAGPAVSAGFYTPLAGNLVFKSKLCPGCLVKGQVDRVPVKVAPESRIAGGRELLQIRPGSECCTVCGKGLAFGRLTGNQGFSGTDEVLDSQNSNGGTPVCSTPCFIEILAIADAVERAAAVGA